MIDFTQVEHSVKELKRQVSRGTIDQQTFETQMMAMVNYAADGHYWMLGYKSERWYWHDGIQWLPGDPDQLRLLNPTYKDPLSLYPPQSLTLAWREVDWGWFIAGLILFGFIAVFVYTSSLV